MSTSIEHRQGMLAHLEQSMPAPTPHPNKITGIRHYGVITIKYTAVYSGSTDLWEVSVTDHIGDVSKDVADDPWTALPELIERALETSRKAVQEMAAS